jgi:hypothetical protein
VKEENKIKNTEYLIEILKKSQYLSGDTIKEYVSNRADSIFVKTDQIFREVDFREGKLERLKCRSDGKKNIFVGFSDLTFNFKYFTYLKFLGYKSIFATNNSLRILKSGFIPLGLSNPNDKSSFPHKLCGDIKPMINTLESQESIKIDFHNLNIYVNFSKATHRIRAKLLDQLRNDKTILNFQFSDTEISQIGRLRYLSEIQRYKLVLCPRGNGLDTHRFWETLYMGGIPIVVRRDLPVGLLDYANFPIIVLNSWQDLRNESEVMNKLRKILSSKIDAKCLEIDYFKKYVESIIDLNATN